MRRADPWITRSFDYPHARVRIRFFRIPAWEGSPAAREHAALAWQRPGEFTLEPMLPANSPVLAALALPDEYAISDAAGMGAAAFLDALERRLGAGLRLVQLRDKQLAPAARARLFRDAAALCDAVGARLLLNADPEEAALLGAAGLHLSTDRLMRTAVRPRFALVGASCHDAGELAHAAALPVDFAVLGPVQPTTSHPGAPALGWPAFSALLEDCPIPVFAIGGLAAADLALARHHGAHGIAMIRGAWNQASGS